MATSAPIRMTIPRLGQNERHFLMATPSLLTSPAAYWLPYVNNYQSLLSSADNRQQASYGAESHRWSTRQGPKLMAQAAAGPLGHAPYPAISPPLYLPNTNTLSRKCTTPVPVAEKPPGPWNSQWESVMPRLVPFPWSSWKRQVDTTFVICAPTHGMSTAGEFPQLPMSCPDWAPLTSESPPKVSSSLPAFVAWNVIRAKAPLEDRS